jgi:hypothetical protein
MGQQHEVELADVEARVEGALVFVAGFGSALKHPAIDQETDIARFNKSAGTGNFASRSEKPETHVFIPPDLA